MDRSVIENLRTILATLHCGKEVDWEKFHKFATSTYEDMIAKYPWYYVPSSVHALLLHGAPVMSTLELPPSFYDEGTIDLTLHPNITSRHCVPILRPKSELQQHPNIVSQHCAPSVS